MNILNVQIFLTFKNILLNSTEVDGDGTLLYIINNKGKLQSKLSNIKLTNSSSKGSLLIYINSNE